MTISTSTAPTLTFRSARPRDRSGIAASSAVQALLMAGALTFGMATQGQASGPRISTGQDLYEACKVLTHFALNPQGPTPRQGLYCRQYLAGYFASARYMRSNEGPSTVLGPPIFETECIALEGQRSYEQLADRVVLNGEWHPELMAQPAIKLVQTTFGDVPPCR